MKLILKNVIDYPLVIIPIFGSSRNYYITDLKEIDLLEEYPILAERPQVIDQFLADLKEHYSRQGSISYEIIKPKDEKVGVKAKVEEVKEEEEEDKETEEDKKRAEELKKKREEGLAKAREKKAEAKKEKENE